VGSWYEDYAQNMSEHGFMSGFADGSFGGERPITRGQFAGIMARMMGIEPGSGTAFADCKGFWGAGYVAAMAERGIIMGRHDGTFGPYDPVTRAQMAAMMDRAWETMHDGLTEEELAHLRDEMEKLMPDTTDHWAEDSITHMHHLGVVQGDGHGHFNPDAQANRAQACAMMWRWFEAHEQQQ
jgi:endo-1,4-beta-xylanase